MKIKHNTLTPLSFTSLWMVVLLWAASCASPDKPKIGGEMSEAAPAGKESFEINDESIGSNVDHASFVHSLSNNGMTSRLVDTEKARSIAGKLSANAKGDERNAKETLAAIIAAERLANAPVDRLMQHAQRLADLELQQGVDKGVSDEVKLELALAALKQRSYGFANFFLEEIAESKNRRVRAGAQNAMGLLALYDERIPEAIQYWRNSLAAVPGYEAALLDLALVSLKYGSFNDAEKLLSRIPNDWFAQSAKLVAARLIGDTAEASRLCGNLLAKHSSHKPTVFNCGVHEWQSNNNIPKAKKLIGQALNLRGGPPSWETQGYKALESIQ